MHGDKTKSISIIIPAHNEEKNIAVCLNSLFSQEIIPTEVLVINDASTDGTESIVKALTIKQPILRLINRQKSNGYTQVILTGIKYAKGDVIAILDADSIAPSFWTKKLLHEFQNEKVGCTGGPYFPSNTHKLIPYLEEVYLKFRNSFKTTNALAGTNLAFDRQKALKINLFDKTPKFSIDKHIQEKMRIAGYSIRVSKNNAILSRAPETIESYFKQWFRWGKGLAARPKDQIKKSIISTSIIASLPIVIIPIIFYPTIFIPYAVIGSISTAYIYFKIPKKPSLFSIPLMLAQKYLGLYARSIGYFKFKLLGR